PHANRRTGSGYSLPRKSQSRRVAQSSLTRKAQRLVAGGIRFLEAHTTGQSRFVCRMRQTSKGRESAGVIGWLFARRRQQPPAEESRHGRELFACFSGRALGPAIRCAVQRTVGLSDSKHL